MSYNNLKVRTKLLLGFGFVILLSVILSVFSIVTLRNLNTSYEELLNHSQLRLKQIFAIETNVMDIRRITTAINAYVGNVDRQEGYKTESANVVADINAKSDYYIELAKNDTMLSPGEMNDIVAKAESLKTVLAEYKAKLIDPNIISAIANDKEAVVANAAQNATLISTLSGTIKELATYEEELTARLSENAVSKEGSSRMIFIAIAAAIVLLSLVTAFYISYTITTPIKAMAGYLNQINATGNLFFPDREWEEAQKIAAGKDEISQSLSDFLRMLKQFRYYGKCLEAVAAQDLTGEIQTVSDSDTCGVALDKMQEALNTMFGEINVVSTQVASGAQQSAQTSQNLSSGATEQSVAIEKFTVHVTGLQSDATENAQVAAESLAEVREAGRLMTDCMNEMNRMLAAMRDIADQSQSISRVIKVIDDIAFQTNILALNAAVEAARAGQHGKGFAVVADEVRNLASKSAEAAKETADLIENSARSVDEGNLIVTKVNEGLQAVAKISEKSAQSIEKLHTASARQSNSMTEIASTIAQLSSVVQANSSIAEEAAASSEEMSAQSAMLTDIVGRFKTRPSGREHSVKTNKTENSAHAGYDYSSNGIALSYRMS